MKCDHNDCQRYGECLNDASPELQLRAWADLFTAQGWTGSLCGRPFYKGMDLTDVVLEARELAAAGDWEGAGAAYAAKIGAAMLEPGWFDEHGGHLIVNQLPHPRSEDDVLLFRYGAERRCTAN